MSAPFRGFSLLKRSNGVYYILFSQNGRRRWKSTGQTTKPEALKALTEFKALLQERTKHVSFSAFRDTFLEYCASTLAPKTNAGFRSILGRFGAYVGDAALVEVTPETLDKYKAIRLKATSPVSVNSELRMLRSAFAYAVRWKLIQENPAQGIALLNVPEQAPMFLSPDEFQRLVSCIREGWLKDIVYFAVLTGMRRGEIFNLQWEQVDLARRLVNIQSRETWKSKQGKRRTIPLSELAANIIASREGKSPSPFVFSHKDGKIDEDWASHVFKRYVRRAGLPNQRLRFHSLRHTFSTWLVQSGVSLAEVQKLLGHSSIAVTEVYAHLQTKNLHSSVNLIRLN